MSHTGFKFFSGLIGTAVVLTFAAVVFCLIDGCTAKPTRTFPAAVHSRQYHPAYWYTTTWTDSNHQTHTQMHYVPERWSVYLTADGWSGSVDVSRETFERLSDGDRVDAQVVKGGITGIESVSGIATIHPKGK